MLEHTINTTNKCKLGCQFYVLWTIKCNILKSHIAPGGISFCPTYFQVIFSAFNIFSELVFVTVSWNHLTTMKVYIKVKSVSQFVSELHVFPKRGAMCVCAKGDPLLCMQLVQYVSYAAKHPLNGNTESHSSLVCGTLQSTCTHTTLKY